MKDELIDPILGDEVWPLTERMICSWDKGGPSINLARPENVSVIGTIWSDYFSRTATHSGDSLKMVVPRMSPARYVTMVFER